MQNKLFAILITALLVMLMAGSAMCATTCGVSYDSNVTLVEKENFTSTWDIVEDGASAIVEYNASGEMFEWRVTGTTPHAGPYCLIYYGDERNDRFAHWGGGYPGALIAIIHASDDNGRGIIDTCGSTELYMNLPSYPDGNMDVYDYSGDPDYYDPGCGAKLWLVPRQQYNTEARSFYPYWTPTEYLFETELIWYNDTGENEPPKVMHTETDKEEYKAGEEVVITVTVCDEDGAGDLENMDVTADLAGTGIEDPVELEFVESVNCICAEYSGSGIVTIAGEFNCEVTAEDPGELTGIKDVCFDVIPGKCIMVIEGPSKAFTHGIVDLKVYCEDEYGNTIGCRTDFGTSITGDASHGADWDNETCSGYIQVVDYGIPGVVTVTSCCICGSEQVQDTHSITYMNQIGGLNLTADPEFLYEISACGDDLDCTNVSAQLTDKDGDPIPMPGISVTFTVEGDSKTEVTDDNGTAVFRLCMDEDYLSSITVEAQMKCITKPIVINVTEPYIYRVEIINETTHGPVDSEMNCTEEQDLNYTCWTDRDTQMCCPECPPATWDATLGEIDEGGVFTANDSGTAVVEVNVSGVIGTVEIVINCSENCSIVDECPCCQYNPIPFVLSSGSVTLTGNHTDVGYACLMALGDPILEWNNDTRGAIVDMEDGTVADATLDLNGTGDTWKYNETAGNWSKYAEGAVSDVSSGTYALVTPAVISDPCEGVTCDDIICYDGNCYNMTCDSGECMRYMMVEECTGTVCNGTDMYNMTCINGECCEYMLIEANCAECGYVTPTPTATSRRSSGSGGSGGTYPPGWGSSTSTGSGTTENATVVEPTPDDPKPADVKPTVNLPGDEVVDTTPDDEEDAPGGADPTNAILVVLGILALLVIGYVLYRKSQNGE